jgi:ATP-dependent RNA helicase DDX19/DBP5
VINSLTKFTDITTKLIVPEEKGMNGKIKEQILSCTPGKLQELMKKRNIEGGHIKMFVLDEADVMIGAENNMGGTVSNIKALLAKNVQVLLFSATYTENVRLFALSVVKDPIKIEVKKEDLTLQTIWQTYVNCGFAKDPEGKYRVLSDLYAVMSMGQSVIFVNSRSLAFDLARKLKAEGLAVSLICGTQKTGPEQIDVKYRDRVIDEFRTGVSKVLVATDLLSRGIDVPACTMVVNYELPGDSGSMAAEAVANRRRPRTNFETYLHRIGRTGRFGQRGIAVNLVFEEELPRIRDVENFYNNKIEEIKADIDELEGKMNDIMKHRAMFG